MPINLPSYTEKELLLRVAEGEEPAFAVLVKRYAGLLYTYIVKLTKDAAIAEDVVQDIFTQLWLTRENLRGVESFRAYLFVISRNHAVRMLKGIDKEYHHRQEWGRLNYEQHNIDDKEAAAVQEAYEGVVKKAVNQLPPQQQRVWLASRQEGKKYAEIAEEMNLSRETVKKYLQLASASITEYIKDHGLGILISYIVTKL